MVEHRTDNAETKVRFLTEPPKNLSARAVRLGTTEIGLPLRAAASRYAGVAETMDNPLSVLEETNKALRPQVLCERDGIGSLGSLKNFCP